MMLAMDALGGAFDRVDWLPVVVVGAALACVKAVLSRFFKQKRPPVWITAVVGVGLVGVLALWHAASMLAGVIAALFLADVIADTITKVWEARGGSGV